MLTEERIVERIDRLREIAAEYEKLDEETNGKYGYRLDEICEEIAILRGVIVDRDTIPLWLERLESDRQEAKKEEIENPVHREWGEVIE